MILSTDIFYVEAEYSKYMVFFTDVEDSRIFVTI